LWLQLEHWDTLLPPALAHPLPVLIRKPQAERPPGQPTCRQTLTTLHPSRRQLGSGEKVYEIKAPPRAAGPALTRKQLPRYIVKAKPEAGCEGAGRGSGQPLASCTTAARLPQRERGGGEGGIQRDRERETRAICIGGVGLACFGLPVPVPRARLDAARLPRLRRPGVVGNVTRRYRQAAKFKDHMLRELFRLIERPIETVPQEDLHAPLN
jgi:hypothetical protein